jgi:hypothetical protein
MTFLFVLINSIKFVVLVLFLLINWYDEGSPGWAFQHAFFLMIFLFIFLPLSFFEKAKLRSRSVLPLVTYIPLFMALLNWIPIFLGNWSTVAFIITQLISIVLTVLVLVVYFRPTLGRAS